MRRIKLTMPAATETVEQNCYAPFARWAVESGSPFILDVITDAPFAGDTVTVELRRAILQDRYTPPPGTEFSVNITAYGFLADEIAVTEGAEPASWDLALSAALEGNTGYALVEVNADVGGSYGGAWCVLLRLVSAG